MFNLGYNVWNNIPVIVIDYRLEFIQREAFLKTLCDSPCGLFHYDEAGIASVDEFYSSCGAEHLRSLAGVIKPYERFIALTQLCIEHLTAEELLAVLYHEESHYLNNDHLFVGEYGVLDDISLELRSDAYAVEKTGADALQSALMKIFQLTALLTQELHGVDYNTTLMNFCMNEEILARFDAIQALQLPQTL